MILFYCLGEDGVVKVWDIRYLCGPTARIDGHYGEITSVSLSNYNLSWLGQQHNVIFFQQDRQTDHGKHGLLVHL